MNQYARKHFVTPFRAMLLPALTAALTAALLPAAAGCVVDDMALDVSDHALEDDVFVPAGDLWNDCSTWDCNKNHPVLNTFRIEELNENGLAEPGGFWITSYVHQGVFRKLDVKGGRIFARNLQGQPIPGGDNVVGSLITVSNGIESWEIMIAAASRSLQYWNSTEHLWAYRLVYRLVSEPEIEVYVDLCNDPPALGDEPGIPEGYETYAIMIDEERYDREAIAVDQVKPAAGWFNIACAGSALSKMVLLSFDPRLPLGHARHTSPAQRTATLKMLTADYTGTGKAFTEPKVPLLWADASSWHPLQPLPSPDTIEAIWSETGARCLNTPRVDAENMLTKINLQLAQHDKDPLPPCTEANLPPVWTALDRWMTYVP